MGIVEPFNQKQIYFCAICNGPGSTRHHLVPKSVRVYRGMLANAIMRLCAPCHREIHYYFSHWELALKFNSEETLKTELKKRKEWEETNTKNTVGFVTNKVWKRWPD